MRYSKLILAVAISFVHFSLSAQAIYDPAQRCSVDANDNCVPNTITSAVPFLAIIPDARSAGMGDTGIATSADANAMFHNASKLAFVTNEVGASSTYSPWLSGLGLTDVYLINLAGYKRLNNLQSIGLDLRFFSLGDISFTDFDGNPLGEGKPRELVLSFAYARKLSTNFSAAITVKYINSNLASGLSVGGIDLVSANEFAADISFTYKKSIGENELTIGSAITNLGSKVSYTNSIFRDFIPANIGIGATYNISMDDYNKLAFSVDLKKLLVPTPIPARIKNGTATGAINPEYDENGNTVADYREKGTFEGIIESFSDAPGGLQEEIKEINVAMGLEYAYDDQFFVRTGYHHESFLKGDRKYLTVGLGIKYNVFGIDLSYLVPTNNRRNPLDNTLRFSLNFNFDAIGNNGSS